MRTAHIFDLASSEVQHPGDATLSEWMTQRSLTSLGSGTRAGTPTVSVSFVEPMDFEALKEMGIFDVVEGARP